MKSKLLKRRGGVKKKIIEKSLEDICWRSWRSDAYWRDEIIQNNTRYTDEYRERICNNLDQVIFKSDGFNPFGNMPDLNIENLPPQNGEENVDMVVIDYF